MDIYINLFPFRKTTLQFVSTFWDHQISLNVLFTFRNFRELLEPFGKWRENLNLNLEFISATERSSKNFFVLHQLRL